MDKLGIAVIGLHMGYGHFKQANEHPSARLVAVCDTNPAEVERVKAEFPVPLATTDYEEVLASPDVHIVSITTPDHFHLEQTLAAFEAGKHVLVEKPMARTVDECAQMVEAARKANKKLMVAHVCRFYSFFADCKRWIDEGTLGEVFHIETSYIHNYEQIPGFDGWRFDPEKRHFLIGGGCHAIDLARWLGGDVEEVSCYSNHFNIPIQQYDDHWNLNVKFKSGAVGRIMASDGCQRPYNIDCQVWGSKGTVQGDNTSPDYKLCLRTIDRHKWLTLPKETMAKAIASEIGHFVDCVVNDTTPLIDGVDGAKTVATGWAAIESSKQGGAPVKVRNEF